jgi:DNA-binding transcriptional LysR family regulator
MLNLTQLKVLEAVARHGSVTVAAKELHYSQPSISHHLGRLEAGTGAKLIQRVGRGIRLTPEGQLLQLETVHDHGNLTVRRPVADLAAWTSRPP